jgi:hypothetical protein
MDQQRPDLANLLLDLLAASGARGSISPAEAAQAWAAQTGRPSWQSCLLEVRSAAVALAHKGRLVVLRKGKPVDPAAFKGVYRLGRAP